MKRNNNGGKFKPPAFVKPAHPGQFNKQLGKSEVIHIADTPEKREILVLDSPPAILPSTESGDLFKIPSSFIPKFTPRPDRKSILSIASTPFIDNEAELLEMMNLFEKNNDNQENRQRKGSTTFYNKLKRDSTASTVSLAQSSPFNNGQVNPLMLDDFDAVNSAAGRRSIGVFESPEINTVDAFGDPFPSFSFMENIYTSDSPKPQNILYNQPALDDDEHLCEEEMRFDSQSMERVLFSDKFQSQLPSRELIDLFSDDESESNQLRASKKLKVSERSSSLKSMRSSSVKSSVPTSSNTSDNGLFIKTSKDRTYTPILPNNNKPKSVPKNIVSERKPNSELEKMVVVDQDEVDPNLLLSRPEFGLPEGIVKSYNEVGIERVYEWQEECLLQPGVLEGKRNLIYSAPTSAGKTMVAELLVAKKVIETKKKAIIILPYVAIVSEKIKYLSKMFESAKLEIVGYYGNSGSSSFDTVDIGICTIEKANSLINKLMEEGKAESLGIVVVDELHMIGDDSRGYLLELLITKLRCIVRDDVQIIGMSATLPNISVLANWLEASLYITDYRPVPLTEYVKIGNTITNVVTGDVRVLSYPKNPRDPDCLIPLVWEVASQNNSVLIFCHSKDSCEKVSKLVAGLLEIPVSDDVLGERHSILSELSRTPGGLDPIFEMTIGRGVAYHHSGLTVEERELIEDAFKAGYIHTLACTSTLASGVNLPARRVIFRSPMIGRDFIDTSSYKQMKGRAGRKGKDTMGESILLCTSQEAKRVRELVVADLEPVKSCLTSERKGMKRALLEVIVNGVVSTDEDVKNYIESTLLFSQQGSHDEVVQGTVDSALEFLKNGDFIEVSSVLVDSVKGELEVDEDGPRYFQKYESTKLGQATVSSALSPEEALVVFEELKKAMKRFVLEDELHIIYQVTPTFINHQPDWSIYLNVYNQLNEVQKLVSEAIGISEWFLIKASTGKLTNQKSQLVHKRFYISLMLNDLENDFKIVMRKFGVNRGMLQSLMSLASTFAGMVSVFCEKLGWSNLELLLDQFKDRLNFGVQKDLLDLVRIPFVKGVRARALFQGGLRTIASIACATPNEIFELLSKIRPFRTLSEEDRNNQVRIELRASHSIVKSAKELLESDRRELEKAVRNFANPNFESKYNPSATKIKNSIIKKKRTSQSSSSSKFVLSSSTKKTPSPTIKNKSVPLYNSLENTPSLNETHHSSHMFKVVHVNQTKQQFQDFLKNWSSLEEFSWNLNQRSFKGEVRIEGIAVCWDNNTVYYIDLSNPEEDVPELTKIFQRDSKKICFEAKQKLKLFYKLLDMKNIPYICDPKVASWCLDPDASELNLTQMVKKYLPRSTFNQNGTKIDKCCRDVVQAKLLMSILESKLASEGLLDYFTNVEMPLIQVLVSLEIVGIGFSASLFLEYWDFFTNCLKTLETSAHEYAGREFSLTSPSQIEVLLYDELAIPYPNEVSDDEDQPQRKRKTNKETLLKIIDEHPIIKVLLEHRQVSNMVSSHLFPLMNVKSHSEVFEMYRVYPQYDFHSATGRVITSSPNLQNVPHPKRELVENESMTIDTINLRDSFIASEGNVFLSADFCQLELRLISHLANEETLLKILNREGDIFISIASLWFEVEYDLVTPLLRKKAKTITYAVMYGIGPASLSEELGVSLDEANYLIQGFRNQYKAIVDYQKKIVQEVTVKGYVETLLKRKRYLPNIHSQTITQRSQAERQALNTTIQGSASDLVKIIMVQVEKELEREFGSENYRDRPHLVLQMHDELVFDIPKDKLARSREIIEKHMTTTVHLRVKLPVRIRVGTKWGSLKE